MALNHSPEEMLANLEYATNSGERLSGRADAVARVGQLLTGTLEPEALENIHLEILTPEDDGSNADYIKGYEEAWDALFNLVYGAEINRLANRLG